jgi:hypothetical protein
VDFAAGTAGGTGSVGFCTETWWRMGRHFVDLTKGSSTPAAV